MYTQQDSPLRLDLNLSLQDAPPSLITSANITQTFRQSMALETQRINLTAGDALPSLEFYSRQGINPVMEGGDAPGAEGRMLCDLGRRYGLHYEQGDFLSGATHTFFFENRNGEREYIHTARVGTSIETIEQALSSYREDMIAAIERNFPVAIGRTGEAAIAPQPLKTPNIAELVAIKESLEKSDPSYFLESEDRMRIELYAESDPERGGFADLNRGVGIYPTTDHLALEALLLHEFAHMGQWRMQGLDRHPGTYYSQEVVSRLGWTDTGEAKGGLANNWILSGRDGSFYAFAERDHATRGTLWAVVDAEGYPVDAKGDRVSHWREGQVRTPEEVANAAVVRPVTGYFDNPWEMSAEALAVYRRGPQGRGELYERSPQLYDITRRIDQMEIDNCYGVGDGRANRIRNQFGRVVENTEEVKHDLFEFERELRRYGIRRSDFVHTDTCGCRR